MPVPGGSGFSAIQQFPEVYHGEGRSKAAFYGTGHRVTKEGENTAYSVTWAGFTPTCRVKWPPRSGGKEADPGLAFFGSRMTKRMIFPVNAIIHNIYIHIC